MAKIRLVKRYGVLIPSLKVDEEAISCLKDGDIYEVEIIKPRNADFHRKYGALIQAVIEYSNYDTFDQVNHLLKLKLGYYDTITNTDGRTTFKPKSISFAAMDDIEFNEFYNHAVNKVLSDFLPLWQERDMQEAIERIIKF